MHTSVITNCENEAPVADVFATCQAPPANLIGPEGDYEPGWFNRYDSAINLDSSTAPARRLQYWFHLHCESDTHYLAANVAQMGVVGNVSLVSIDKLTGEFKHSSEKRWLWRNQIKQTGGCALIWDPISGSSVAQDRKGSIHFHIRTDEASFVGTAEPALGPAFVQSTPGGNGYGSLQWWGPMRLNDGHFSMGQTDVQLPQGSLGGFDRTIGHRNRRQHWNWLSAQGSALSQDGDATPFAVQFAVDNLRNPLLPNPKKFNFWIHGRLYKFDSVEFSPGEVWRITASGNGVANSMTLQFTPHWCREEKSGHAKWFGGHFRQYYGQVDGQLSLDGQRYTVSVPFGLLEDSRLSL